MVSSMTVSMIHTFVKDYIVDIKAGRDFFERISNPYNITKTEQVQYTVPLDKYNQSLAVVLKQVETEYSKLITFVNPETQNQLKELLSK